MELVEKSGLGDLKAAEVSYKKGLEVEPGDLLARLRVCRFTDELKGIRKSM